MTFRQATAADFEYVLANMRQEDRIEQAAMGETLENFSSQPCVALTLYEGDLPICVFGASRDGDTAHMFRIATDMWPEVVGQAVRFGRRVMLPKLRECGVKRVEATHRDIPDATAWLRLFGAKKVDTFDKNGETFATFAVDLH